MQNRGVRTLVYPRIWHNLVNCRNTGEQHKQMRWLVPLWNPEDSTQLHLSSIPESETQWKTSGFSCTFDNVALVFFFFSINKTLYIPQIKPRTKPFHVLKIIWDRIHLSPICALLLCLQRNWMSCENGCMKNILEKATKYLFWLWFTSSLSHEK